MSSANEVGPTNAETPVVSAPPAKRSTEENGATAPNTMLDGGGMEAGQAEGAGEGTIMASRGAMEWGGGSADTGNNCKQYNSPATVVPLSLLLQ